RLLLAEDDPDIAAALLRDLADDYDVSLAPDGEAALLAARDTNFDLVLLDYQMPRRDGVEVVRSLRTQPAYRQTPILLLTAVGSDAAVEAAFDAGADDYINKPYRRRTLLARLARHLGRMPPQTPEPPSSAPSLIPTAAVVDAQITALFCDISDFTSLSEQLPPREVLALLNRYFSLISRPITSRGGALEKYIGDALLATWGVPTSRDDDVLRAIEAAVEIQALIEREPLLPDRHLTVHIGINSGLVAAGTIGDEGMSQFATIGNTTAITSRLCNLAEAGEIVVSGESVSALAGRSPWPLLGPVSARVDGCSDAVPVYRVDWRRQR
ncbi:MAG: response regulator, partial [Myxococcales bacterium]|nr:response regulator [Myxococcales bacterium]